MEEQIVNLLITNNEKLCEIVELLDYIFVVLLFIGGYCIFDAVRYQILRKVQ